MQWKQWKFFTIRPELEYLGGRTFPKVSPKRTHALVQRAALSILERCAADYGEFGAQWRFKLGLRDGTSDSFCRTLPSFRLRAYRN